MQVLNRDFENLEKVEKEKKGFFWQRKESKQKSTPVAADTTTPTQARNDSPDTVEKDTGKKGSAFFWRKKDAETTDLPTPEIGKRYQPLTLPQRNLGEHNTPLHFCVYESASLIQPVDADSPVHLSYSHPPQNIDQCAPKPWETYRATRAGRIAASYSRLMSLESSVHIVGS